MSTITPPTHAMTSASQPRPLRLGEMLCQRGLITQDQLAKALHEQETASPRKQLAQILVDNGIVSIADMTQVLAESVGTPFATLAPRLIQPDALASLPTDFLEKHNLLPMSLAEGWLTIAVEQFTNIFLLEEIAHRSGAKVQVIAAVPENIRSTRHSLFNHTAATQPGAAMHGKPSADLDVLLGPMAADDLTLVKAEEEPIGDIEANATDSPVVKLVNFVIKSAVESRASDIHIEPDENAFRVRFRVDGDLVESIRPPAKLLPAVVSRIKILAGLDISERRLPQDGAMTVTLSSRPIDLRVSTMTTKFGEKVVLRIVDRDAAVKGLETLGFEPAMLKRFRSAVQAADGIVLVTGPTGSGKTTTLYSALSEIVSTRYNISTIEDPVERRLTGTNQFQIHNQAGFTFASALRSLLRQDPDVIMVGEIRDTETARLATEAALTGHLVLSTLHTNDAPTAVPRLINMGVEPYLVAASLRAVLAQRLVRQICPRCRVAQSPSDTARETLAHLCKGECPLDSFFIGKGCGHCRGLGYMGRIGVHELLMLNEEMLSVIARDQGITGLRDIARRHGWTTLLHDGLEKVRQGLISLDGLLEIVSRSEE